MKKKILFVASTVSHIRNFHLPYLKAFHDLDYEVHVLADEIAFVEYADMVFASPFTKNLFSLRNLSAMVSTWKLLKRENYEKISSNTTLAGVIVRVAAIFIKNRPRIYHIVHGYLFNMNDKAKKYMHLFFEKIAASVSNVVMVMNHEDEAIAIKYKLYREKLIFINGMGINPERFLSVDMQHKNILREKLGFMQNSFLYVYAAEFSKRKNHAALLRAFAKIQTPDSILVLAGEGILLKDVRALAFKLGISDRTRFLGFVKAIPKLYAACDAAVSTSRIEGLPFNIIEAIGCGLPVVASDIKGHRQLVENAVTGYLYKDEAGLIEGLQRVRMLKFDNPLGRVEQYMLQNVIDNIMRYYQL